MGVLAQIAAIIAAVIAVLLLVAILLAVLFFVGITTVGWLSVLAPAEELAALRPVRRQIVTVRGLLVLGVFWLLLLGRTTDESRDDNPGGREAFAYYIPLMRRLSGLPAQRPSSPTSPGQADGP